jgi:hypothetical protein
MNLLTLPPFFRDLLRNIMNILPARQIVRERNMKRKETLKKTVRAPLQLGEKILQKKDIIRPIRRMRIHTSVN